MAILTSIPNFNVSPSNGVANVSTGIKVRFQRDATAPSLNNKLHVSDSVADYFNSVNNLLSLIDVQKTSDNSSVPYTLKLNDITDADTNGIYDNNQDILEITFGEPENNYATLLEEGEEYKIIVSDEGLQKIFSQPAGDTFETTFTVVAAPTKSWDTEGTPYLKSFDTEADPGFKKSWTTENTPYSKSFDTETQPVYSRSWTTEGTPYSKSWTTTVEVESNENIEIIYSEDCNTVNLKINNREVGAYNAVVVNEKTGLNVPIASYDENTVTEFILTVTEDSSYYIKITGPDGPIYDQSAPFICRIIKYLNDLQNDAGEAVYKDESICVDVNVIEALVLSIYHAIAIGESAKAIDTINFIQNNFIETDCCE